MVQAILAQQNTLVYAHTLSDARRELGRASFDLILLDVLLPDGDGFAFYAELSAQDHLRCIPVIFVTARSEVPSEVMGFSLGAWDYVTKPVEPARFRARIEARLRQLQEQRDRELILQKGDLRLNVSMQRVSLMRDGREEEVIDLTPVEFKLLFHLLRHEGHVFSRDQLLTSVWGNAAEVFDRTVDMHVSNLRKKISESEHKIQAVHGMGYRLSRPLLKA